MEDDRLSWSSMTVRDDDLEVSGVWNESDLTINYSSSDESIVTICPEEPQDPAPTNKATSSACGVFKKPAPPKAIFAKCTICRRSLKTERGFNNYTMMHRWKEAASRCPSSTIVVNHLKKEQENILHKMASANDKEVSNVCLGALEKIKSEEWDHFYVEVLKVINSGLDNQTNLVMPHAVRADLQRSMSLWISKETFRSSILESFQKIGIYNSVSVFWLFLFDLMKELGDAAILFLCRSMIKKGGGSVSVPTRGGDVAHHLTDQVVHYIAGAALRHYVRRARQYPHYVKLENIKNCILAKFASIGSPPILDAKDKGFWTQLMNRKSLLFINDKAFSFFNHLSKLLMRSEGMDGSLMHDKIMDAVVKDSVMLGLWSSVVEFSLDEHVSFDFMCKIVRITTNTYGRGVLLRRINAYCKSAKSNKSTLQVSHRGRLI